MDRRNFFAATGAAAASTFAAPPMLAAPAQAQTGRALPPLKVKLGHEVGALTDEACAYCARLGVEWIGAAPAIADKARLYPTADELKAMRDRAEKHGLHLETVSSPLLNSSLVDREPHPAIVLGQSPERDRDIEAFQTQIKNCAAAGIPTLKYNMSILGVVRSADVPGRGDSINGRWDQAADKAKNPNPPLTRAGVVDADEFWRRIDYFLARVVPVADEYKVNIACHPQDPGITAPGGYRGIDRVLGTVDGLKRLVTMHESPHHGLNFCQGTISEDLEDPNAQIGDVIRWFGTRGKIFNVHFRNIKGGRGNFTAEMFPDEGSVDFVKALKVYREVGYDRMLIPDHAPRVANAPDPQVAALENFAFELGYIRGLIQAEQHVT